MINITNDVMLAVIISHDLKMIVQEVVNEIIEMIEDSILAIVYEPYTPSAYKRQEEDGGFLGSWRNDQIVDNGFIKKKTFFTTIFSDAKRMIYDPGQYIHGGNGEDRRDILDAAIAEGKDYDFDTGDGWWQEPRDYWTPVIDMLGARHHFQILFEQKMRDKGISFKKV